MLVRIVAIVYLIVTGAAAYSSLNDTYSETNTPNSSIMAEREHDTARIPKVYALKTLNNVLTKIMDRKKVTKPTTLRPTSAKPKINCNSGHLVVILDNSKFLSKKEYARVLAFVAEVSAAWRSNLKCRIAFIPLSVGTIKPIDNGKEITIDIINFEKTENWDEYEIKAEVYKIQYGKEIKDPMEGSLIAAAVESATGLIPNKMPPVQTNVLLITATATHKTPPGTMEWIDKFTSKMNVNTLAIGVSGNIKEDLLTALTEDTNKVKLIQSVEELKDCTDFVQKNLK